MSTKTTNYELEKPEYSDAADVKVINDNMDIIDGQMKTNADNITAVNSRLPEDDGTEGQVMRSKGDGTSEWVTYGDPSDEQVDAAVSDWLDDHPEATTTVEDGAVSRAKLDADLKEKTDEVPLLKSALAPIEPITISGHYINQNGSIGDSATRYITDYIPCTAGLTVKYKGETNRTDISALTFFNAAKEPIETNVNVGAINTIYTDTAPANTAYVVLSWSTTASGFIAVDSCVYAVLNELRTYKDDIEDIQDDITDIESDISSLENNLKSNDDATYIIRPSKNQYDGTQDKVALWVNGTSSVQISSTAKSLVFPLPANHGRCFITVDREKTGTILRAGTLENYPAYGETYSYVVQGQTKTLTIECAPDDEYLFLTYYNSATDTLTEEQLLLGLTVYIGAIVTNEYAKVDYEKIELTNFVNAKYVRYSDKAIISYTSQTDTFGLYDVVPLLESSTELIAFCSSFNTFVSKITFLSSETLAQGNVVGVWTNEAVGVYTVEIPTGAKYVCIANECDANGNVIGNPIVLYHSSDLISQVIENEQKINGMGTTVYDSLVYTDRFNSQRRDSLTNTIAKLKAGTLKYTVLGDSITDTWDGHNHAGGGASDAAHGYAKIVYRWLKQKYGNSIQFTNNGTGGITVTGTMEVVDQYIEDQGYDLCIVELGTNDWNVQTSISTFKTNYKALLDTILAYNNPPEIFIIGLGYFGSWHSERAIKEKQYNDALREIAEEYDVPFADPYDGMKEEIDFGTYTFADLTYEPDPVHPNDAGHRIWANEVYNVFAEIMK